MKFLIFTVCIMLGHGAWAMGGGQHCLTLNLAQPRTVSDFFNGRVNWTEVKAGTNFIDTVDGTIKGRVNFNSPKDSQFSVDGKSAPIQNLAVTNDCKIKFDLTNPKDGSTHPVVVSNMGSAAAPRLRITAWSGALSASFELVPSKNALPAPPEPEAKTTAQ